MGFAENIETLMVENDVNATAIARAAGVSGATVSGWCHGAQPRMKNVEKLADRYGLTVDDLLSDGYGLSAKLHDFAWWGRESRDRLHRHVIGSE